MSPGGRPTSPDDGRSDTVPTQGEVSSATSTDDYSGKISDANFFPLDRYEPYERLGTGASGQVYLCHDKLLKKNVAVKTLRQLTEDQLIGFQMEARATSSLQHTSIVKVLDFGVTKSGAPFMVMDYVPGINLADQIRNVGPMPWYAALEMAIQLASALQYAHDSGIYHRDLKPSNILMVENSSDELQVRLIDFGVAKVKHLEGHSTLIQGVTVVGTPFYMSPDQLDGKSYDARSEVYALGCVLFETLAGQPPFDGETALDILALHSSEPPPAISSISPAGSEPIPPEVEKFINTCLAKDPRDRFQSMAIVKKKCEELLHNIDEIQEVDVQPVREHEQKVKGSVLIPLFIGAALASAGFLVVPNLIAEFNKSEDNKHAGGSKQEERRSAVEYDRAIQSMTETHALTVTLPYEKGARKPDTKPVPQASRKLTVEGDDTILSMTDMMNADNALATASLPASKIETAWFNNSDISDNGLTPLKKLPHLRVLGLGRTIISDKGLETIAQLKSIEDLWLGKTLVTDQGMSLLEGLPRLQTLGLEQTEVSDAGLQALGKCKRLDELWLNQSQVGDEGLKYLINLRLDALGLSGTHVSDRGCAQIARIKSLQTLQLANTAVTNQSLTALSVLPKLTHLDLSGTEVNDQGLKALSRMNNLDELMLANTKVTGRELPWSSPIDTLSLARTQVNDKVLALVVRLKTLERLSLANTKITDSGLTYLSRLEELQELDLSGTPITNRGMRFLARLGLRELSINNCHRVTAAGITEFRQYSQCRLINGVSKTRTE